MNFIKNAYLASYRKAHAGAREPADLAEFNFRHIRVGIHRFDEDGFQDWVALNNWTERFPSYSDQWLPPRQPEGTMLRKLNEHYISTELGQLRALGKTELIVDVAAAGSPFQQVLAGLGFQNVFKSDLNFETNLEKKQLGGGRSRSFRHFGDESVSLMVAHNSIEHFERGEDLALFKEINRVLRLGGRFVWVPLGLVAGGLSETDPDCWESKYSNTSRWPRFERRYPVDISDRKQRLMKWWDPMHLESQLKRFAPNCSITIYQLENALAGKYCLVLEKQ